MKQRVFYLTSVIIVIILGIASRKINGIPLFIGDLLYAVMIYTGLRLVLLRSFGFTAILALTFCFAIELSQLLTWQSLVDLRKTTLGHYALGEGFLYSDLIAYFLGITIACLADWLYCKCDYSSKSS